MMLAIVSAGIGHRQPICSSPLTAALITDQSDHQEVGQELSPTADRHAQITCAPLHPASKSPMISKLISPWIADRRTSQPPSHLPTRSSSHVDILLETRRQDGRTDVHLQNASAPQPQPAASFVKCSKRLCGRSCGLKSRLSLEPKN